MKFHMSTIDLAIWLALIAGKVILCLCILKRGMLRRLPWFSAYVFGFTIKSLLLVVAASFLSYNIYYYAFTVTGILESGLALFTLAEFAVQVFPGFKDIPRNRAALAWMIAALGSVVAFVGIWSFRYAEKRIQVAAYLVIAVAFIVTAAYARSLRLSWSRLLGGVSFTLGGLYLADGIAKVLMGYYRYPDPVWFAVRRASEVATLLAVISWTVFVLIPWGEYKLTEEDLAKFEAIVNAAEENVRRFIASGGQ